MFNPNEHLMNLKGKEYLQVMWRLVWFREEKPLWAIDTKLEQLTDKHAVFSAKIYDENGALKSAGYGSESMTDFRDFIEKAETKAVGRALAMLGYGTQFAPEMDECEDGKNRIVDSPVPRKKPTEGHKCASCGTQIAPLTTNTGKVIGAEQLCNMSLAKYGKILCIDCAEKMKQEGKNNE